MKSDLTTIDLLLVFSILEEWPLINHQVYTAIKYIIIMYLIIKYGMNFYRITNEEKSFKYASVLLIVFTALSTFSTFLYTQKITWMISALMNGVGYLAIFASIYSIYAKRGGVHVLKTLFFALLIVLFINDILMIFIPYNFTSPSEKYLIGNKFAVSYYHCFLFIISKAYSTVCDSHNKEQYERLTYVLGVFGTIICSIVHCSTGLIVCVVSLVLILVPLNFKELFLNKYGVGILLFIEDFLIFGSAQLLKHPLVQSFIVNVLGKSENFTGRFKIFDVLDEVIAKKPLLGYGYNTVTDIITEICGYGNAQNGVKQLLIQFGYIGTTLLFIVLFIFVGKNKDNDNTTHNMFIMLFALSIASAVEITLSNLFIFGVALIGGYIFINNQNKGEILTMQNVTFIIKTFERPSCIKRLVKSIYKKYPDASILIADDSDSSCKEYLEKKYSVKSLEVFELEKDQGLSFGRNYLVDRVKTKYFVLLDDDFVFDSKTDIQAGLDLIEKSNLDILGGYIRNYCMEDGFVSYVKLIIQNLIKYEKPANYMGTFSFDEDERKLYVKRIRNDFPEYKETDIVLNFFIAKTDVIRTINRWDDELKLQEHTAFFYKAKLNKLKIAFTNKFSVQHKPLRLKDYGTYRGRDFTQLFLEKYDIHEVISTFEDGEVTVTKNENY